MPPLLKWQKIIKNIFFSVWGWSLKKDYKCFVIKKNKLLWEADKNSSKRTKKKEKRKKKKKFKKIFFEKDSKNSNLDFTRNVVKRFYIFFQIFSGQSACSIFFGARRSSFRFIPTRKKRVVGGEKMTMSLKIDIDQNLIKKFKIWELW